MHTGNDTDRDHEHCKQAIKVKYDNKGRLSEITTCNCPKMTYNLIKRLIVKVDYRLDRRLSEFLAAMGTETSSRTLPGRSEVIRTALEEYLQKRGY